MGEQDDSFRQDFPSYRMIFCSFAFPYKPGFSGGEIRDYHILDRLLSLGSLSFLALRDAEADGRIDLLGPRLHSFSASDSLLPEDSLQQYRQMSRGGLLQSLHQALAVRGLPVIGPRYHWDVARDLPEIFSRLAPKLQVALENERHDFLFISPQINPVALALDTLELPTRLIMASYDIEVFRIRSLAKTAGGLARIALSLEVKRAARFERENLEKFDGIIAVSELDRSRFVGRYGFPPERVLVIENGVDTGHFEFHGRRHSAHPEILFVGNLGYIPNQQAARRLLDRIMPRVRQRRPDARLWIVGQNARHAGLSPSKSERLVITDQVPDVRPFLELASLACAPLIAGGGTKYKILEALSAGVPLVCTPIALEGLDLEPGQHLLVGDSDDELVTAIMRLLDDPALASTLAKNARAAIERIYDWRVNLPRLDPWLAMISKMPRRWTA